MDQQSVIQLTAAVLTLAAPALVLMAGRRSPPKREPEPFAPSEIRMLFALGAHDRQSTPV